MKRFVEGASGRVGQGGSRLDPFLFQAQYRFHPLGLTCFEADDDDDDDDDDDVFQQLFRYV